MTQDEVELGVYVVTDSGVRGAVTRVTRSRWRHRLLRFWVYWQSPCGSSEAEHMPEDAQYLTIL